MNTRILRSDVVGIGHRGSMELEPENTLRGFQRAIDDGMKYVELDVQRCKTGELVVVHDETVDRTTNGNGKVEDLSLQQLQELDAGKGEKIQTFKDVLAFAKGKIGIEAELKAEGVEEDVVNLVSEAGMKKNVFVSSFNHKWMLKIKEISDIKTCIILIGTPVAPLDIAIKAKADFWDSVIESYTPALVDELREGGVEIVGGGCNTKEQIEKALSLGIKYISGNNTQLIKENL